MGLSEGVNRALPRVMGVDIASGGPGTPSSRYAVVVIEGENRVVARHESVPLARLIRLAWTLEPEVIAVDNIFELGRSEHDVTRIVSLLPPKTRIVQVTLEGGKLAALREVAARHGVKLEGKPTPTATAYVLAVLALKGVGTVVSRLEEKTVITVSRKRAGSPGGWSQQRYQRKVRAAIASAVASIRESLDRAGIDYDLRYRKSEGGIDSATFIVYAPRDKLSGIVKPVTTPDYAVRIKPDFKTRVLSLPQKSGWPHRPLIVGIDPGITTGLVVLDMSGRPVHVESGKNLDRSRVTEIVYSLGRPVVVAVDVASPPETARKLAAQWGAVLYHPPEDLSSSEKRILASKLLSGEALDTHIRDAAAAAYKAFQALRSKLDVVERTIERMGIELDSNRIKMEVVRGASIADALERAIEEKISLETGGKPGEGDPSLRRAGMEGQASAIYKEIDELREALEALKLENNSLRRRVEGLEAEKRRLERMLEYERSRLRVEVLKEREVEMLRQKIRMLEERLSRVESEAERARGSARALARAVELLGSGRYLMAVPLERLTLKSVKEAVARAEGFVGSRVLVLLDEGSFTWDAVKELSEAGVDAVIVRHPDSPSANALRSAGIPVISRSEADLLSIERFLLVSHSVVGIAERIRREREKARRRTVSLEKILEEYRHARRSGGSRGGGMWRT